MSTPKKDLNELNLEPLGMMAPDNCCPPPDQNVGCTPITLDTCCPPPSADDDAPC